MWSCRTASLLCAGLLVGIETLGLCFPLLFPLTLPLALARLALAFVWVRCWAGSSVAGRGSPGAALGCGAKSAQALRAEAVLEARAAAAGHSQGRTWRSAGVQLPAPKLVMNLIKSRRSVFCKDMEPAGGRLDPATLRMLLEAASWAPSHGRTDPWHFVVFQSRQSLALLEDLSVAVLRRHKGDAAAAVAREEFAPGKRWARAACLIAICVRRTPRCAGGPGRPSTYNPDWEEVAAVACAVQNLHIMATALPGICGYWSSWYESVRCSPELHSLLHLHQGDRCLGFFVLGHCDRVGYMRASRRPVSADWR